MSCSCGNVMTTYPQDEADARSMGFVWAKGGRMCIRCNRDDEEVIKALLDSFE